MDLLATCAGLLLLLGLAIPMLATNKSQSEGLVCAGNLRHVGRAFNLWASDHGNEYPWRVPPTHGGIYDPPGNIIIPGLTILSFGLRNNVFVQFAFIYRELETPSMLVCPSDADRKVATAFPANGSSGFLDLNLRNRAVSYFIGVDGKMTEPRQVLSGDRSIAVHGLDANSSAFLGLTHYISVAPPITQLGWKSVPHGQTGNLLFQDGSVEAVSSSQLDQVWNETLRRRIMGHYMLP